MVKEQYLELYNLLDDLMMSDAPCKGCGCVGHQNCNFGENGCYGDSCAIKDVADEIGRIVLTRYGKWD